MLVTSSVLALYLLRVDRKLKVAFVIIDECHKQFGAAKSKKANSKQISDAMKWLRADCVLGLSGK